MHTVRSQYFSLALFTLIATTSVVALPVDMSVAAKRFPGSIPSSFTPDLVPAADRRRKHTSSSSTDSSILTSLNSASGTPSSGAIPPTATGNTTMSGGGNSTGLPALFPMANSVANWTTYPGAPGALDLSDATLKPFKVESGMTHNYTTAPDGKGTLAMQAVYPNGSYIPSKEPHGGFSFYATGPDSVNITNAKELTFGYSVMFPEDFDWVKGGKLPGIYGGDNATTAVSCSGGRRDTTCFSARLMWRAEGAGELYTYLPDPSLGPQFAPNQHICSTPPTSLCNDQYGWSIGRGAFTFAAGEWTTVSERVKLNSGPDTADGELELFVGGKSVINATGIILRDSDEGRMRGIQMQTFFGGSTPDYASPKEQEVYFADFSVAILDTL